MIPSLGPRLLHDPSSGSSEYPDRPGAAETAVASAERELTLLVFHVGTCWFAVDALVTEELAAVQEATPVPGAPAHVRGLVQLRGRAIPIVDLKTFLALPDDDEAPARRDDDGVERIVVVSTAGMRVGFLSDRVRGLFKVPAHALGAPDALTGRVRQFARAHVTDPTGAHGNELTIVLDIEALLEAARVRPEEE